MAELLKAKIVTVSTPYLVKEGNSWCSTCVYEKNGEFFQKNAVPPSLDHGPWEIGEEVDITPSNLDKEAADWMIEIYNSPKNYKAIILQKKARDKELKEQQLEEERNKDKPGALTIITNVIIVLAVIAIIGIILYTFIKGA